MLSACAVLQRDKLKLMLVESRGTTESQRHGVAQRISPYALSLCFKIINLGGLNSFLTVCFVFAAFAVVNKTEISQWKITQLP